jgi:misacylated tRNA(Ala) deacylase
MTTALLFRDDAYLREAKTRVLGHTPEGGIVVEASVFYATGGGQPAVRCRLPRRCGWRAA